MQLHEYQQRGAEFIRQNPSSYMALDVGLGKSATTLTAIDRLLTDCDIMTPLVIAPKRVAEHTWPTECATWANGRSLRVITGTPKQRLAAVMGPEEIKVISRDNVQWLVDTFEGRWPFDCLVIDEAQNFKDASSKRFKALKKVRKHFERVILLSATPATESLLGLYSQLFLMDGGKRLGKTFSSFRDAFFVGDYMGWSYELRPGAEVQIRERIADVFYTLRAEDYLTLPARIDNLIDVELSPIDLREYRQLEKEYILPLSDTPVTAANAAVLAGKLLQLSGGAVYDEEKRVRILNNAKIDALAELIDSANGNPVLVFYSYKHERDRILKKIHGSADLDVDLWNAGKQSVALAHPQSAGAGLNLQAGGNVICWYSLPWSLELYIQANGRLHRQGQKNAVVINHLITKDTIDEAVLVALHDKHAGQESLLNALKKRIEGAK